MEIANKVLVLPNICGIEIDASGTPLPTINPSLQPFVNTVMQNQDAKKTYTTPGGAQFRQSGREVRAGLEYTQELRFSFPGNDPLQVTRLNEYLKAKYIYIKLDSGMVQLMGRNDYFQNAPLKKSITITEKTIQLTFQTKSITPAGFTNGSEAFDLPGEFPINLYNLYNL